MQVEFTSLYEKLAFVTHDDKGYSEIILFEMYLSESGSSYIVNFDKVIRPFNSKVNPFKVQEIAFHQELPIIFVALEQYGVLAYNLANYDSIFSIDLRHLPDTMTLFP